MTQMVVLVEGRTEARFVDEILQPYLNPESDPEGPWLTSRIVETSRTPAGQRGMGGGSRWRHYDRNLQVLLQGRHWSRVGLLLDYYAYPRDGPGSSATGSGPVRHKIMLNALQHAYPDTRFVPGIALHEFETWVLAAVIESGSLLGDAGAAHGLQIVVDKFEGSVEAVNDGKNTARSKRLAHAFPGYSKTIDGIAAISDAGLERVVAGCPSLAEWLDRLVAPVA